MLTRKKKPVETSSHPPSAGYLNFPYELTPYYEKPGLIGKGGFARVFRVNRKKDNAEVAIKIPISMDPSIGTTGWL